MRLGRVVTTVPNQILIVDDDADLIEGLRWYLEAENFEVVVANDGESALARFREKKPDLVILDIMMPGIDGLKVCETITAESDVMVMMLSAKNLEIDKVRAFQLGADDYVTKPFHALELVARVKALIRRMSKGTVASPSYKWKNLAVYVDEHRVAVGDTNIELTAMQFELLVALMKRPHVVFTREQLVEVVWGGEFFGELRLVDNLIYRMRERLSAAGCSDLPIVAIRGVGYAYRPEG
ncbi:MAG: response regulator transcription factor [Armatimonadota bacterium]